MIHGIDNYEKLKVIRPVWDTNSYDCMKMPIVKKLTEDMFDFEALKVLNIQNLSSNRKLEDCLVIAFNFDNKLEKYWNDPFKYIPRLQRVAVCCTPDFSIYPSMNYWQIAHNVFKNRWLGYLWQEYDIPVICSVSWATSETYDICFAGIEQGSIVAISTLGCTTKFSKIFLEGYREMMERIRPSLVIVFGRYITGIYGRILLVKYEESFSNYFGSEQPTLFDFPKIIEIQGEN